MADDTLPLGKLPVPLLRQFLNGLPGDNPDVVVGPGIGEDAAVIRFGETMLVFKTDPITFAVDDIAWYLVTINANDIACMGGIPEYLLVTFLLPQGSTTPQSAQALFSSLTSACERNAVTLVGGHTEITRGIDRPIAIGFMVGTLSQHGVIRSSDARPGDAILLSKGIPIEATSLLAREFPGKLGLDDAALRRAQNLIYDPGISITRDALIALSCGGVTAMHDPTEGARHRSLRAFERLGLRHGGTRREHPPRRPRREDPSSLLHRSPGRACLGLAHRVLPLRERRGDTRGVGPGGHPRDAHRHRDRRTRDHPLPGRETRTPAGLPRRRDHEGLLSSGIVNMTVPAGHTTPPTENTTSMPKTSITILESIRASVVTCS